MTADPRFVSSHARKRLISELRAIQPDLVQRLEEEIVDPYPTALERLRHAGVHLKWK